MSWFFRAGGATQGPIERQALVELLRKGIITPQVEVSEDSTTWSIAATVPGLMNEVYSAQPGTPAPGAAPQSSPPAPPSPAAPVSVAPAPIAPQTSIPGSNSSIAGPSAPQPIAPPSAIVPPPPPAAAEPDSIPEPPDAKPKQAQIELEKKETPDLVNPVTVSPEPVKPSPISLTIEIPIPATPAPASPPPPPPPQSAAISPPTPPQGSITSPSPAIAAPTPPAAPIAPPTPPAASITPPTPPASAPASPSVSIDHPQPTISAPSPQTPSTIDTGKKAPGQPTTADGSEEKRSPSLDKPSPIGQLVLDPAARQKAKAEAKKRGRASHFAKLAAYGVLGLAVLGGVGILAATKLFGLDLRPARIDTSVSKFMVEEPIAVARIDIDSIFESEAYKRALPAGQSNSGIMSGMAYLKDAEDMILVTNDLSTENYNFLVIANLKRDYRKEFVANILKDSSTEYVGDFQMHIDANGLGDSNPYAISLPEPRTLLIGSPFLIKTVLERNEHPKLFPKESEMIASTHSGNSISMAFSTEQVKKQVAEARSEFKQSRKEKEAALPEEQEKFLEDYWDAMEQGLDDTDYILDRIDFVQIEVNITDTIDASISADCGSTKKADKVAQKLAGLMTGSFLKFDDKNSKAAEQLGRFTPLANGSKVEITASFDPRGDDFSRDIIQSLAQGGGPSF